MNNPKQSHVIYRISNRDDILVVAFHKTRLEVWDHLQKHRKYSVLSSLPWNF
jgi:hypothetical protein